MILFKRMFNLYPEIHLLTQTCVYHVWNQSSKTKRCPHVS